MTLHTKLACNGLSDSWSKNENNKSRKEDGFIVASSRGTLKGLIGVVGGMTGVVKGASLVFIDGEAGLTVAVDDVSVSDGAEKTLKLFKILSVISFTSDVKTSVDILGNLKV